MQVFWYLLHTHPWHERFTKFRFPLSTSLEGATFVFPSVGRGVARITWHRHIPIILGNRYKVVGATDGTTRGHVAPSSVVLQSFLCGAGRRPLLLLRSSGDAPEGKRASGALRVGATELRQVLLPARVHRRQDPGSQVSRRASGQTDGSPAAGVPRLSHVVVFDQRQGLCRQGLLLERLHREPRRGRATFDGLDATRPGACVLVLEARGRPGVDPAPVVEVRGRSDGIAAGVLRGGLRQARAASVNSKYHQLGCFPQL